MPYLGERTWEQNISLVRPQLVVGCSHTAILPSNDGGTPWKALGHLIIVYWEVILHDN
jgi:hypothetical protein